MCVGRLQGQADEIRSDRDRRWPGWREGRRPGCPPSAKRWHWSKEGRARYRDNARGGIIGDDAGFLKLIYRADEMRLIGAHMIGEQSIELINIGLLILQMNGTFQPFIDACFNFPTLTELYKYATYDAMKRKQQGRVQGSPAVSDAARPI
jgi:hypothetical protein